MTAATPARMDCPKCPEPDTVDSIEPETTDHPYLILQGEPQRQIVSFTLRPCGHSFSVSEWLLMTDEDGTRFVPRKQVMLTDESGHYWRQA